MPKRKNVQKSNRPRKRRKLNRGPRRPATSDHKQLVQASLMLRNPCTATLRPGFHATAEGVLSRFQSTETNAAAAPSGYVLWSPHYVSGTGTGNECAMIFNTATPQQIPTNSVAEPFGTSATGFITPKSLNVGASSFVSSAAVSDFRLLSSCMRMTYEGKMQDTSGSFAFVENLPIDALFKGGTGGQPMTVNEIFASQAKHDRLPVKVVEIRHRPDAAMNSSFKSDSDALYAKGTPGASVTSLSNESKRFNPTVFGFAWRGVPDTQAFLSFDFIQNIEWRPDGASGLVQSVPRQLHDSTWYSRVAKYMDDTFPDWTTVGLNASIDIAAALVGAVYAPKTGSTNKYPGHGRSL